MKTPIKVTFYCSTLLPFGIENVYHAHFDDIGFSRNAYDDAIKKIMIYHSKTKVYSISTEVGLTYLRISLEMYKE